MDRVEGADFFEAKLDRLNEALWALRKDAQERNAASAAERAERAKWESRFLWIVGLYVATVIAFALFIVGLVITHA